MLSALALYDRGVAHSNAGRHAAARVALTAALDRCDDVDLTARIAGTLAYLDSETGDPDGAVARLIEARSAAGVSDHTVAILTSQLGLIAMRRGDSVGALPALTAAIAALDDDPARLGRVHLNRGIVYLQTGDMALAEADFGAASAAFARSAEPIEQAKALHNQGYAALLTGDVIAALKLMDEARPVLATLSPVALATCDQDRAEVLLAAGMATEATELLSHVASVYGSRRLRQAQAEAELVIARTLSFSDARGAGTIARRAARRFRAQGSESWAAKADAVATTAAVLAGRHGTSLIAQAEDAAALLDAHGMPNDALAMRLQLARLRVRASEFDTARRALAEASEGPPAPIATRLLASEVSAELAEATGQPRSQLDRAREGLDELQAWQASFGSMELQSTLVFHGRQLVGHGIRAALADGRPTTVFEWSERTRSLTSRIVPLRPPANAEAAADLSELRQLRAAAPAPGTAQAKRERVLGDRIRRRQWTEQGSGSLATLATLDEVGAQLADTDAVLLAYLWSGQRVSALVVTGTDAKVVDLGEWLSVSALLDGLLADLDMTAAVLSPAMRLAVRGSLDARLARLAERLVAPLAPLISTARVVITPPAVLAGVPWTMLPGLADRAVTIPASATRWLEQRGDLLDLVSAGFAAGPGVERAEAEVREAALSWASSRALVGAEATSARVAALAERVDVLHIAAHGRHAADNPLFSGIELADGPWFGYDIDNIDTVPATVILSACELGRSAVRWGQEALGMAQSWLHAGARCVIAAPASVNDDVAHAVLTAAHEALARGAAPADALVVASARSGLGAGAASGFQCYGAGW